MAVTGTRTWALVLAAVGVAATGGCVKSTSAGHRQQIPAAVQDPPLRQGLDTIAIVMPARVQTEEVRDALIDELSTEFNVTTITVDEGTSTRSVGERIEGAKPSCIVAMDNRTLRLYRDLQRAHPARQFPPVVVLMTSFLDQVIGTLRNATGIAYEVPVVTSFVALREIAKKPIRKIGVVHRRVFAGVVEAQARLAAVEKLTLVPAEVGDSPSPLDVDDAVFSLLHDDKVDALWVLNDNALLTHDAIAESWLPRLHDRPVPVVVGVSALVHPEVEFGTVAVLPDNKQLGVQAASTIFDLSENDWQVENGAVDLPLAVQTVVDVRQVRDRFGLQPGALKKIDKIVE